jgi:hypothetical protein
MPHFPIGIGDPRDPIAEADPWSRQVLFLEMYFGDELISTGTGFIIATDRPYLITALHCLTGREPVTLINKSKTGAWPNFVSYSGWYCKGREPLYRDDNKPAESRRCYLLHERGSRIDVTAIPLRARPPDHSILYNGFIDPEENSRWIRLYVSQTCHIIGYPEGLAIRPSPDVVFPVWKTGTIASEPYVDVDEDPKLLVDARTYRGMSGAPVIVRVQNYTRLVGVYSGRTDDRSDIGFVFKPNVVNEVLHKGSDATDLK